MTTVIHCSVSLNCSIVCACISLHQLRVRGSHKHCQSFAAISHLHLKSYVFDNAVIRNLPVFYRYCDQYIVVMLCDLRRIVLK